MENIQEYSHNNEEEDFPPPQQPDEAPNNDCDFLEPTPPPPSPPPEEVNLALLSPDDPLMQKFQQVLREHLLRTKEQLVKDICDIKHELKHKELERENLGAKLYDTQQELRHQNEQLEEYGIQIQTNVEKRHALEESVQRLKSEFDEKQKLTKEQKHDYNKRMMELENTNSLEKNIHEWADEIEDEVKNAKRIVSRDAQLQKQLSEEKRKSDLLFYHLDTEVKNRTNELKNVREELTDQKQVIEVLRTSIRYADTDLEAIQSEHKSLTQSWAEVIVAISHRDKILFQVKTSMDKEKETIKLCTFGIEAIRKQIFKEMRLNENLKVFKNRITEEFTGLQQECQKQSEILNVLEKKLLEIPLILDRTEKDFHEAKKEGCQFEAEIRRLHFALSRQNQKKFEYEEEILQYAEENLITDKASEYRFKILRKMQDQRRRSELTLAQTQNQLAVTLLDLEKYKGLLQRLRHEQDVVEEKMSKAKEKSDNIEEELKSLEYQVIIKMKTLDKLNGEVSKRMKDTDGTEMSPTEYKIKQIEKSIGAREQQIRSFQQYWLMLQNHFVNLSNKRREQLNAIHVTRKQLSVIKQKSLKIDNELEKAEKTSSELNRDISAILTKIQLLNVDLSKKRIEHETEETECESEHSELMDKLKLKEMAVLNLEADINDLQSDIEHYKELVLDKHRESLTWETKYKLIEETLLWQKGERAPNSEITTMRSEIHRMEIRHNQLKRAQEKLVLDLEHCVMHREQIFVAANIKERIEAKPQQRAKAPSTTQQKVTDLRNKLKVMQNEISLMTDGQLFKCTLEHERIYNDIKKIHADIDRVTSEDALLRAEIDEGALLKHLNLEAIVRKQNRAKSYRRLNNSTLPQKIPRSEAVLDQQTQKQNDMNDTLVDVVQTLTTEFPEKQAFFAKILQILRD